ncbi:formin-1-like [Zingiber officinale]|uniref:formin-1-like n=1 Tax=Zingiber officinale TaxID=94328 RepID=UPI001C4C98AB|nr:formin-1-like [Zingiber officinale]
MDPAQPIYIPDRGLGRRFVNVPQASPAFREASQAACQASSANDRLGQDAPSSTRRRAQPSSDDSDSDSQPLSQRRRRRAPRPVSDSGPSSIPSPPPVAAASPPPPIVTPPPIPSQVNDPPTPSDTQVEPLLAQPSTSQQLQGGEAGPFERPSTTPPSAPSQEPPSAPSGSTVGPSSPLGSVAGPSERPSSTPPSAPSQEPPSAPSGSTVGLSVPLGSAAGPSEPPPLTHYCYCTTTPSEERLWSRADVPTSSLRIKGRLATLWEESIQHMNSLPPPAQMDKFSELYIKACAESMAVNNSFHAIHYQNKMLRDKVAELELQLNGPVQASHALRAEIKDMTKKKNSLEVSLAQANYELKGLKEEQSRVDVVHQQSIDQQALEHQRAMDQLAQKLRAAETLTQEQDKKLKSQEAQLTSQTVELTAARNELARATAEGASTVLAIYKEGENGRCQQNRALYLRSPEFCTQAGQRFSTSVIYGAGGALRQLYEQDYLKSVSPPEFLDHDRILKEIPDEIFPPFK